ncbi:3-hydroxyacyl-CoA dehydrogenase NAD-binding domain-containing protein [Pseudorhodoferax sp. Leaf265]|uniref:3-hydroxyacyl-CoA dehydrogenase NAD-binding domain-containing protein n=1 Tax=Pseudorhodoferax sp. Leaf265 TaxID=1736315 RepID=UPI000A701CCB|nr:3-hydroxyacyl-CoA dehydrogenase NAD-binding domain-containing protein [Pseudorhodoferax sp. Leaf265]
MTATSAITYHKDEQRIVTLTIDMPGQSANTMNGVFREAYAGVVERLEAERDAIAGVILTSAKKTFFAGGDLNNLLAARPEDAAALFERAEGMKALMRRLETLGRPVVAAINGTALGGGFELCLACHARFVVDDPQLQLGLPEARLGLLPGAGGVVRTVRMLGLQAAVPFLVDGTTFGPARALELKLLDGLAPDLPGVLAMARAWIAANPGSLQPWDRKGFRIPGSTERSPAPLAWLRTAPVLQMKKQRGLYPAPEAAMSAAIEGATVDFDTASRIESRYIVHLATHPVAKNLITTFFFQMNEIKAGKGRPEGVAPARFARIGILGAGLMGSGIAQVCGQRGLQAVLKDATLEQAQAGKARVEKALAKRVEKGALSAERMQRTLDAITPAGAAADLQGCDLIVEAVFEKRELKAAVTRESEPYLAAGGIFASNTSTLPITGLAEASKRPENFIGLHFFSPVDRMALVEIIKGAETSPETLARAYDFVQQLGKTPIVVNDSRGFFTSRVFGTFTKEGAALLAEGVPAAEIENGALSVGMPVGPLAVMDETSMALSWSVRQQTIADLQAAGEAVPQHSGWAVIEKMVALGRPGRAGGGGFYDYPEGGRKQLWQGLAAQFPAHSTPVPYADLRDRLLYVQALESVRCVQEGVIEAARDANIGSVVGIGFPRWTGGTLQYINSIGLRNFVRRAGELAQRYGQRFEPPRLLVDMAERQGTF